MNQEAFFSSVCSLQETTFNSESESGVSSGCLEKFSLRLHRDFPSKADSRSSEAFRSVNEADLFSSLVCWVRNGSCPTEQNEICYHVFNGICDRVSLTFMQRHERVTGIHRCFSYRHSSCILVKFVLEVLFFTDF